jgi:DNA-binding NarL/FixJ family response regulator
MVRILLADDRIFMRRGLRALLEVQPNFDVCAEASDGREAVELALHHKPDVVILDMVLPVIDGITATRRIRKDAPATEVMVFTLHDREEDIHAVLHAGARGYVFKSEADDQVIKAIDALSRHCAFFSTHLPEALLSNFNGHEHLAGQSRALTAREIEVVRLIAEGKSNKNIAFVLEISAKTVESHRSSSMRKLNVHSTAQLVRYAIRYGLVEP